MLYKQIICIFNLTEVYLIRLVSYSPCIAVTVDIHCQTPLWLNVAEQIRTYTTQKTKTNTKHDTTGWNRLLYSYFIKEKQQQQQNYTMSSEVGITHTHAHTHARTHTQLNIFTVLCSMCFQACTFSIQSTRNS